jgi:HYR domain
LSLFEDLIARDESLGDVVDRSDHTITELPSSDGGSGGTGWSSGGVIITGGISGSGQVLGTTASLESSSATVTTDKTDYQPGDTVIITGTNWQAGETVELTLHRDNETPDTVLSAVADADGNIQNAEYLVQQTDLGVVFLLTAIGESSSYSAQTTFTDGINKVAITSPTTASPTTITSLPTSVTIAFDYQTTGIGGTITAQASVKSGATVIASNSKTIPRDNGGGSESIIVTIPVGTANGSYAAEVTVTQTAGTNPGSLTDSQTNAIIVNTATAPTISCPSDIVVDNAPGQCSASVSFSTTTTGTPTPTVQCKIGSTVITSPDTFAVGTTSVTCTATNSGGSASCSFSVTVQDHEAPVPSCPTNITKNTDPGVCNAVVSFTATSTDNCDGTVTPLCDHTSGSAFPKGTTTVQCTATDVAGNSASCSFDVIVEDHEAPVPTCPANITKNTDPGVCNAVISFTATATDNCDGSVTPLCDHTSGSAFPKGTTTVHCTATDVAGNFASCSFDVTVEDHEAPVPTCPSNITKNTDPGVCDALVAFSATATDNCDGTVTPVCDHPSGSTFPKGATTVHCTATDLAGNYASCSFDVTVIDNEDPTISCPADITAFLPPNSSATSVAVSYSVTANDNCPGVTAVSNPPSGSLFPVGNSTVTSTATDAAGHTKTCTFKVTVCYNFTGFFPPIDNLPIVNVAKAGSAIPIKFSLSGYKGLNIFETGYPASGIVACNFADPAATVEETVNAGGSSLSYDPGADQYTYVWKTEKSWSGCRMLAVKLKDGKTYSANFKFK